MAEPLYQTIVQALWLFLPAYLANVAPVFVGGGLPIDGGRNWRDGHRLLGDGKTWRGLFLGPLAAALAMLLFFAARVPLGSLLRTPLDDFGPWPVAFAIAYLLGFGALVGDTVKSFFKRRFAKDRGARWLGPDQYDFVLGAFLFGYVFAFAWMSAHWTLARVLVIVIFTPGLHLLVNYIGWKLGTKNVPW